MQCDSERQSAESSAIQHLICARQTLPVCLNIMLHLSLLMYEHFTSSSHFRDVKCGTLKSGSVKDGFDYIYPILFALRRYAFY